MKYLQNNIDNSNWKFLDIQLPVYGRQRLYDEIHDKLYINLNRLHGPIYMVHRHGV